MIRCIIFFAAIHASCGVIIEAFSDNACTSSVRCSRAAREPSHAPSHAPYSPIPSLQIGNLTNFVAYAGSCNIIPSPFGGPGGGSQARPLAAGVALDVCTPSGITVALFQSVFTNDWNAGISPCTNPRAATVNLALDG